MTPCQISHFPFAHRIAGILYAAQQEAKRRGMAAALPRTVFTHQTIIYPPSFLPSIHPGVFVIIIFITILVLFAIEQPNLVNSRFTCVKFSKFEVLLPKRL